MMFQRFGGGGRFVAQYRCYPVSFIDRPQLENGDKVVLPPSALDRMTQMMIDDFPMLFEVTNQHQNKTTHCGVLEFIADEGVVYLPYWMMQNLVLSEGDIVKFQSVSLPKGKYVKLRPQTKDFLDISNPKAVLETTLRNYTCLTVGDSVLINYNNKRFYIDIIEAKPNHAVSIIETDCEVDFAPPLDYVEPVYEKPKPPASAKAAAGSDGASGSAQPGGKGKEVEEVPPSEDKEAPKFLAFAGGGHRLDGKALSGAAPIAVDIPTTSLNIPKEFEAMMRGGANPENDNEEKKDLGEGTDGAPKRKSGKLVFGGARAAAAKKKEAKKEEEEKKEENTSSFQAFSGKGNKLR